MSTATVDADSSGVTSAPQATPQSGPPLLVLAPERDVDTEELAAIATLLGELSGRVSGLTTRLDAVSSGVANAASSQGLAHHYSSFQYQSESLRGGPDGLIPVATELDEMAWRVNQVRYLYDDAEGIVSSMAPSPEHIAEILGLIAVTRFGEDPGLWGTVIPTIGTGISGSPDAWIMLFHPRFQHVLRGAFSSPQWRTAQDLIGMTLLVQSLARVGISLLTEPDVPNSVIVRNNLHHLSGRIPEWGSSQVDLMLEQLGLPARGEEHNDMQASSLTVLAWMHTLFGLPLISSLGSRPRGGFEYVRSIPLTSQGRRPPGPWPGIPLTADGGRSATPLDSGSTAVVPVSFGHDIEPLSTAEVIRRFDVLKDHYDATGNSTVEIVRTATADGAAGWTVIVPGTKDWTVGTNQVTDMDTNSSGMAGEQTHMAMAVAQAMDQMGIPPGEPVSLFGHSQGGIVAAEIAADPILQSQYEISSVVTIGSPTAHIDIPEHTAALHLADSQDIVTGMDGARTPATENRVTVTALSPPTSNPVATHYAAPYAQIAERFDELDDARLANVRQAVESSFGAGQEVSGTRSYTFEVERY